MYWSLSIFSLIKEVIWCSLFLWHLSLLFNWALLCSKAFCLADAVLDCIVFNVPLLPFVWSTKSRYLKFCFSKYIWKSKRTAVASGLRTVSFLQAISICTKVTLQLWFWEHWFGSIGIIIPGMLMPPESARQWTVGVGKKQWWKGSV